MIFKIENTERYFDINGMPQSLRILTEAEARNRGFLPPLPKTAEEELCATLSVQANAQIEELIFIRGDKSLHAKVGRKVIADRKARAEKEDREAQAEKAAAEAAGVTAENIPSRIPR